MYNQYLQQVIDRGLDMLRSGNVTQDMFNVWLDWSQTVLRLIVKNPKTHIPLQFLRPSIPGIFW